MLSATSFAVGLRCSWRISFAVVRLRAVRLGALVALLTAVAAALLTVLRLALVLWLNTLLTAFATRLAVAFGCTGGQHRSVYCAERLATHLRAKVGVDVEVEHAAQAYWKVQPTQNAPQ